jgi:hypothetical protein
MKVENLLTVKRYYYKGIGVIVRLDYSKKTVDLVEWDKIADDYVPKHFIFTGRTLEYMAGWRLILDAIDHAVAEATKELNEIKDKETERFLDYHLQLSEAMKKDKK